MVKIQSNNVNEFEFLNIENLQDLSKLVQIFVDSKTSFGTFQIRQTSLLNVLLRGI